MENFKCAVCGTQVLGTGYTNHCPNCLWSLHCDINPGDRENSCRGLMRPVALSIRHSVKSILHRCEKCREEHKNKSAPEDNMDALLSLPLIDEKQLDEKRRRRT